VDPNYPRALHVRAPLREGEWHWRVLYEREAGGKTTVRFDDQHRFVVKKPPYARYAFDFGGDGMLTEPNFVSVGPSTTYTEETGYGWVAPGNLKVENQPQALYRLTEKKARSKGTTPTALTPLLRDLVQGTGEGTFKARLPNGTYDIHLVAGHVYYQHKPSYAEFDVWIEGAKEGTVPIYVGGVFFERQRYTVDVEDGVLDITFRSDKLDRAWFVNGLLVYPRAARREARWEVDRLHRSIACLPDDVMQMRAPYPVAALDDEPKETPPISRQQKDSGLVLFSRGLYSEMYPRTVPRASEMVATLRSFATPGEFVDLTFSAYALKDLDDVSLSATDLKGGQGTIGVSNVRVRRVALNAMRHKGRGASRGDYYRLAPDRVETFRTVDLDRDRTRQFWLTLRVPPETGPGKYGGGVDMTVKGRKLQSLAVEIEVLPFGLVPHQLALEVYFGSQMSSVPRDSTKAIREEARRVRALYLADVDEHLRGVNMALVVDDGFDVRRGKDGSIEVDSSHALQTIHDYREAGVRVTSATVGFQHLLHRLALLVAPAEAKKFSINRIPVPLQLPPAFDEALTDVVRVMDREVRKAGVDQTIYYIWDEASGDNERLMVIRTANVIRRVVKNPLVYCNLSPTTYYGYDKPELALAPHCNVWWVYNRFADEEREREAKRGTIMLGAFGHKGRPEHARAGSGYLMWRSRQGGANMWGYDIWRGSYSTQLDGPFYGDACQVYPTTPITPRLSWEAVRQGLYDFRYLLTLRDMIARAKTPGQAEAAAAAQVWLDELWEYIDPNKLFPPAMNVPPDCSLWDDPSQYQKHRRRIADHILRLIKAGVAPARMRTDAGEGGSG